MPSSRSVGRTAFSTCQPHTCRGVGVQADAAHNRPTATGRRVGAGAHHPTPASTEHSPCQEALTGRDGERLLTRRMLGACRCRVVCPGAYPPASGGWAIVCSICLNSHAAAGVRLARGERRSAHAAGAGHRAGRLQPLRPRSAHRNRHRADSLGPGDFRGSTPRYNGEALQANLPIVQTVTGIADSHGASAAQVALAWVLSRGDGVVPLAGSSRPAHVENSAAAVDLVLTEADLARIDEVVPAAGARGARYPEPAMRLIDAG